MTDGEALDALERGLRVRRIALDGFSRGVLPPDRQTGELEERAVLVHLSHRHEVTAVARLVGGVRYRYGLAGDTEGPGTAPVDADTQHTALKTLAGLLRAEQLALPSAVLDTLTPPATRYARTDQYYDTAAGRVFDPFEAVRAAATLVIGELLAPARLNRLAWQHAVAPATPSVSEVVEALLLATWQRPDLVPAHVPGGEAVQQTADWTLLNHILTVLGDPALHRSVRTELRAALRDIDESEAAETVAAYLADPTSVRLDPLPRIPPGAPN